MSQPGPSIEESLRNGVLSREFVALAADLGAPIAVAAVGVSSSGEHLSDWLKRAERLIEARKPLRDDFTNELWVDRALGFIRLTVAYHVLTLLLEKGSGMRSQEAFMPALKMIRGLAGHLKVEISAEAFDSAQEELVLQADELSAVGQENSSHAIEIIRCIGASEFFDDSWGLFAQALRSGIDQVEAVTLRELLSEDVGKWLLDPKGPPHTLRAWSDAERNQQRVMAEQESAQHEAQRDLLGKLSGLDKRSLVRVLIVAAEVELFEGVFDAERTSCAERALAAAKAWVNSPHDRLEDVARVAGGEATGLVAGAAATACARAKVIVEKTCLDAITGLPEETQAIALARVRDILGKER